jgi:hypothetical protein
LKRSERSRFGIAEGLILIAGVAAGLASVKALMPEFNPQRAFDAFVKLTERWSVWDAFAMFVELNLLLGIPFLAAWTPSCLVVHLVKPRDSWHRLRRQPGFLACLTATAVIVPAFAASAMSAWFSIGMNTRSAPERFISVYLLTGVLAGSGVLWNWLTLWLCGVFRPRPTSKDRLGRLTGAAWLVTGASAVFFITFVI